MKQIRKKVSSTNSKYNDIVLTLCKKMWKNKSVYKLINPIIPDNQSLLPVRFINGEINELLISEILNPYTKGYSIYDVEKFFNDNNISLCIIIACATSQLFLK